jgi:hypothetical protein
MTPLSHPLSLRALSVRQPWANRIADGSKQIEFRSRATKVRGRILVVSSLNTSEQGTEPPYGVSVCTVKLWHADGGKWYLSGPEPAERVAVRGRLGFWDAGPWVRCPTCRIWHRYNGSTPYCQRSSCQETISSR